nr:immunoglobulin heavy chain junction region [Macaca mulatta]MOY22050.1 immunoglobulin heavy chain junction region [Macaca mulatta]MOY22482.1 immunoglobulin heavy chain junction region [Macaca mulatta]MOY22635.1 immunoglobulin heavy chain junction region [Macaca mulatta]MOY22949.1 immunoglobulin heavy chain junction region [Macaca mulatta]
CVRVGRGSRYYGLDSW